jgi:major type 1 subunit fimbrin (pilin)
MSTKIMIASPNFPAKQRNNVLRVGVIGLLAMLSHSAFAVEAGTLNFEGQVTAATCNVGVNGGTAIATITLPTVSTVALAAPGSTAGRTFVTMDLTGCTPATGNVHVFFEASPQITVDGRLANQTPVGAGAENVEIQMLNSNSGVIDLAKPDGGQNSVSQAISSAGTATLTHYAQYYAIAQSTPGLVTAQLEYVLSYN